MRGWSITAVVGAGYVDPDHMVDPERGHDYDETDARTELAAHVRSALGDDPGVTVDLRVERDLGAASLLALSHDAGMLVVGARGLGGFRGLLLGSVSQQCLHHATTPVAVVRQPAHHEGPPRVVVGVDSSQVARTALRWAVEEARLRHAELEVIHSWHLPYSGAYPFAITTDPAPFEEEAVALVDAELSAVDTSGLAGPVQRKVCVEAARSALLEASQSADLVVLGSHGVGGFRGMLLGSVSHALAQHAACPVLVVPPERPPT